jgi:hypothetical protein
VNKNSKEGEKLLLIEVLLLILLATAFVVGISPTLALKGLKMLLLVLVSLPLFPIIVTDIQDITDWETNPHRRREKR